MREIEVFYHPDNKYSPWMASTTAPGDKFMRVYGHGKTQEAALKNLRIKYDNYNLDKPLRKTIIEEDWDAPQDQQEGSG